jgi:hypothetical protein
MSRRGLYARACGCAAACLLGAGAVAASAAAGSTPPKDTFHGRIAKATGALQKDRDEVTILLHIPHSTEATRHLELELVGAACGTAPHCLRLTGTLSGTLSAHPTTIPDVGRRYELSVSGSSAPLGRVSGSGTVSGVGFIRQGHEGLTLTLRAKRGTLTINAVSPTVPGFTSP